MKFRQQQKVAKTAKNWTAWERKSDW